MTKILICLVGLSVLSGRSPSLTCGTSYHYDTVPTVRWRSIVLVCSILLCAACSRERSDSSKVVKEPAREVEPTTTSSDDGSSGKTEDAGEAGRAGKGANGGKSLFIDVEILGKPARLKLPYAKHPTYLAYLEGKTPFEEAFRKRAPAILSSPATVAERLAQIDELHRATRKAFVDAGKGGRDPAVGSFDAALEDLVMAYFEATWRAIVASQMPIEKKREALAELEIEKLDVLAWAPMLKASITFHGVEGNTELDRQAR